MSIRRLWLVTQLDLQESLRRPFFWFWVIFMGWNSWMVSRGAWLVQSNSTSLGGNLSYVNSEFQIAYVSAIMGFFVLSFFVAIAAGTPLIREAENKVGEVLHATPLSPGEYVWGKFLGAFGTTLAVLALFIAMTILFTHGMPNPERPEAYGPFSLRLYVVPILVILVPTALFIAGAAFALGRFTGNPILVFFLPVAGFIFYWGFFWGWNPPDISETTRFWVQMLDPSGFKWLRHTYLTVDRGIEYYNTRPIDWSPAYLLSRLGVGLVGLLLVDLSRRHFANRLKTAKSAPRRQRRQHNTAAEAPAMAPTSEPLGALGMTSRARGGLSGVLTVARFEVKELFSHPALYVLSFISLLLMTFFFVAQFENEFQTEIYLTPGAAAAGSLNILTANLLLLLLFYTVESLRREPATGAAAVIYASPVRTASLLLGKMLANGAVVFMILLATLVTAWWVLQNQGGVVDLDLAPFLIVWGLLLTPTVILWVSFLLAAYAVTRSQYGAYAAGFVALGLTIWALVEGNMTWIGNWALFGAVGNWTDMGLFPMDRAALALNRLMALGLAALLLYLAFRLFARQDRDPLHPLFGRQPGQRRRTLLTALLLAAAPLALGYALWSQVNQGYQGGAALRHREDYWRFNHATWLDQPVPYIANVEMDLDLEPATRGFRVNGFYDLRNDHGQPLPWFPVTTGMHWQELSWTLNGKPVQPEDSHGLQIFRPAQPLPPGGTLRLGFRYRATLLPGISRNGGAIPLGEFITPAGGIVTGRNPDFVPVIRYLPEIGADPENQHEAERRAHQPKTFPPGWHRGITQAEIDRSAFTHRLRISLPAEYMLTSTGALASNEVKDGRRNMLWVTDYPVRVFNIAFGRWQERRGKHGTAIYHHPGHTYNVDSMLEALDGARVHFDEWFYPYPWRELRLNEFPNLDQYGRGNATNIFFSEGIGFLTRQMPDQDAAFWIAAHEAAHSWWGHIVQDGEGPGGIVMSEGTAQFATRLLIEKLRGPQPSIGLAVRDENDYGEFRQPSDEKPLAGTYRFRPGDPVVIYNKGSWVMWMLMNHMGRERFFEGTRDYFKIYHNNPDHPVVHDFVAVMRRHAADKAAYDDFARQWFFGIVIPEYQVFDAKKEQRGGEWEVTVRVKNAGTGRMPVEVAATAGWRWGEDGKVSPDYKEARVTLVLGAGEEKLARIRCPFEPQAVVVDPDANVLQLQRQAAAARL
ncbi:MAG TPA: ABC transporter permease [Thermoanaerobaculia bacterium]|nr:ABC transporter permease [Thermoanaerobaculia bacterium]